LIAGERGSGPDYILVASKATMLLCLLCLIVGLRI
jgi:hypothetical protein